MSRLCTCFLDGGFGLGGLGGLTFVGGWVRLTLYQRRAGGSKKNDAAAGVGGFEGVVGGVLVVAVVGMMVL